jgi:arabinose-5-phosphate isomerase
MNIFIDCDETICYYKNTERKYENALPIQKNIEKINRLYEQNHNITIWTARGTVTKIDYTELTEKQLKKWGVKYHNLLLGKPSYDLYIDDKSINSIFDWNDNTIDTILNKKQYNYLNNNKTAELLLKQKEQLNIFFNEINQEQLNKVVDYILDYNILYFIGVGKSENIARHTTDTLKSININANLLNSTNLSHGDIGGVIEKSLVFVYTKSGNTSELELPIFLLKQKQCFIILVSTQKGKLSNKCDYWMQIPLSDELDNMNIIPTTSITFYSIFTNLIVSMIINKRNITIDDYKHNHIAGNIGHNLFTKVKDVYKKKDDINCHFYYTNNISCRDIIFKITESKIGMCILLNSDDTIYGIITDGGIRQCMIKNNNYDLCAINIDVLINKNPFIINYLESLVSSYDEIYNYAPVIKNNKYIGVFKFEK